MWKFVLLKLQIGSDTTASFAVLYKNRFVLGLE